MSVNKIALLIAYQELTGTDSPDAKGMRADAQNYKNFLKEPFGGGWNDSEIIIKLSPSKRELLQIIDNFAMGKDYAMIGFFGHGSYSEKDDDIMLQINYSEHIPLLSLRNKAPKSLIVIDCCRAISEEEEITTEGLEHFASQQTVLDQKRCRQLYDYYVERADGGNTILYACSPYEKSFGSVTGGIYTKSLIKTARDWEKYLAITAKAETPYCLSVIQAHNKASEIVEGKQSKQHPDIEKSRSGYYLPFSVAFYKENQ